jgi:hypothetical protein
MWELIKEATLWNTGASYKTVTEIKTLRAIENGEVEEVVEIVEVVE